MQRKAWTLEQDKILKQLYINRKLTKWSQIARTMDVQFKLSGRTGKQCRQRWCNQLDPKIKNVEWSKDQQQKLFKLHDEMGNSWAKIAAQLQGRTDNSIKNHFYSTLRKAVRKVNRYLSQLKNKDYIKQIKNVMLNKIMTVAEDKFQKKLNIDRKLIDSCIKIKQKLIQIISEDEENESEQKMRYIVHEIMNFNKNYKIKRPKKKKKQEEQSEIQSIQKIDLIKVENKPIVSKQQQIPETKRPDLKNLRLPKLKTCLVQQIQQIQPLPFQKKSLKFFENQFIGQSGLELSNFFNSIPVFTKIKQQNQNYQSFVYTINPNNNNISLQQSNLFANSSKIFTFESVNSEVYNQKDK